ncbi:MAG: SDR family NAD(P)-dependent oxidoreductase [Pseudomonadales bacterium]
MMNDYSFQDKTVVITGASAGVGAACARTFAQQKSKLVLVARGEAALNTIAEELSAETEVLTVAMDVANTTDCMTLFEKAVAKFGAVHVLVNNAGLHTRGPVETRTPEDLAAMVDVNMRAPLVLTAAALPLIRQAGGGAVVMVGSLAGLAPLQGAATYSATKAGLRAFSYALADELQGSSIHIGVVSPGPIDTGFIMDEIDQVEDIVFSQPMSTAEDVADAVMALAQGGRIEIAMPAASGKLASLGYLFPSFRRKSRGMLYSKGRKNKEKYRQRAATEASDN